MPEACLLATKSSDTVLSYLDHAETQNLVVDRTVYLHGVVLVQCDRQLGNDLRLLFHRLSLPRAYADVNNKTETNNGCYKTHNH